MHADAEPAPAPEHPRFPAATFAITLVRRLGRMDILGGIVKRGYDRDLGSAAAFASA